MPELPEVEIIRRSLLPWVVGATITSIRVRERRLRCPINADQLQKFGQGQKIADISRKAKYLLLHLESKAVVIVHLGMSGQLLLCKNGTPLQKHDHVVFTLDNDKELRYNDPRRFGLIEVVSPKEAVGYKRFQNLGLEPLSEACTGRYFYECARGRKKAVKNFLTDAAIVVGVGNIYANEALFRAGVSPKRSVKTIGLKTWARICSAVKQVLKEALTQGGTTINNFRDGNGKPGFFQVSLQVYGREGKPCLRCGSAIRRVVQAGRSSFYCPHCQR